MTQDSSNPALEQNDLIFALTLGAATCLLGLSLSFFVWRSGLTSLDIYGNSFHVLFVRNEPVVFLLLFFGAGFGRLYLLGDLVLPAWPRRLSPNTLAKFPWLGVIVVSVVVCCWSGNYLVLHDFPLSNDEFLPSFQAQIFLSGKIRALLPLEMREFGRALTPIFALYDPQAGSWISSYLPIYALVRTFFLSLGVESLTGPALAGLSLVLIAGITRRFWPEESLAPFIAVILLVSSSQFLITSMTSYAYPAHLCFNLAWLYFYCRGDRLSYLLTPWIGFFALGLHNPFVHALFVTPFLLSFLWQKNWKTIIYFGLIYAGGCLWWFYWWTQIVHLANQDMNAFQFPNTYQLLIQPMNFALLFSWNSLALTVLGILALCQWSTLPALFRILAGGCFLTFGFFFFFSLDQVLGWGYRFFYGVLGNFVLLAVAGWYWLRDFVGAKKAWGLVLASTILALAVQFPIRCLQVESFIDPFDKSARYLNSLPYPFIIIDPAKVWYAQLLVRNDPFLRNHPKFLFAPYLDASQLDNLKNLGEVHVMEPEALAQFGLHQIVTRHASR